VPSVTPAVAAVTLPLYPVHAHPAVHGHTTAADRQPAPPICDGGEPAGAMATLASARSKAGPRLPGIFIARLIAIILVAGIDESPGERWLSTTDRGAPLGSCGQSRYRLRRVPSGPVLP